MQSETIKPVKDSTEGKKEQVEKMFDNISGNYDFLNRMITFGMDKGWRKNVKKQVAALSPKDILDVATGTGDMAILLSEIENTQILGVDISKGMLDVAEQKIAAKSLEDRIRTEVQDSEHLNLEDNSFDAATVIYGIRNFENLSQGLSEILRVLRPNAALVILETSVPENAFIRWGYMLYTKHIMPRLAKLFSKDKTAYKYLSDSAINFPSGQKLKKILEDVGYKNVKIKAQFFGVSTIYYAEK